MMLVANKTQLSRFGVLGKETRELSVGTTSSKLILAWGQWASNDLQHVFLAHDATFFVSSTVPESSHVIKYLRYLTIVLRPADPQRFVNI
jgi:hypothetical protein